MLEVICHRSTGDADEEIRTNTMLKCLQLEHY